MIKCPIVPTDWRVVISERCTRVFPQSIKASARTGVSNTPAKGDIYSTQVTLLTTCSYSVVIPRNPQPTSGTTTLASPSLLAYLGCHECQNDPSIQPTLGSRVSIFAGPIITISRARSLKIMRNDRQFQEATLEEHAMHCSLIDSSTCTRKLALWAKLSEISSLDNENERLAGTEVSSGGLDVDI
jgi:hypothetical protein